MDASHRTLVTCMSMRFRCVRLNGACSPPGQLLCVDTLGRTILIHGFASVGKTDGPLQPRTEIYDANMGCKFKRARAAAGGKPEGLYVLSRDFLQHVVVIVVP